ncbi:NAD(P)H nitroreductase, partial [Thermococcus sp. ES12]|nr:NAD(P)H nitroreductase [Thermococcus sp. ES12]
CWGHIHERMHDEKKTAEDYVRELLRIPKHIKILCIIGIGYPAEEKPEHRKEEIMWERVHLNKFGNRLK